MANERWSHDRLYEAIRALPAEQRARLVERLVRELADFRGDAQTDPADVIGAFADEPDLIDDVCASAMESRVRDPLRRHDA